MCCLLCIVYHARWHAHSVKDEKCIIEYIFEASKTYENSQEFIEDLLNLGRWPLVKTNSSVEVCALFSCKLKNFISASKLRTTVCEILHKVGSAYCMYIKYMYILHYCGFVCD